MTESSPQSTFLAKRGVSIDIDGVFNVRSFGGYPSNLRPNCFTRDSIIYRSGHLKDITSRGTIQIRDLGISTVIDLTNSGETKALFTGTSSLSQCKVLNLPLAKHGFSVQQLADKYKRYLEEGEKAIAEGYLKLLIEGHQVIRDILFLILDNPDDVFLVHCAMGKDRTGVVFAVLLSLAGVPDDAIADEYSRSELALEAALPEIAAAIKKAIPTVTDTEALKRARIVIQTRKEAMLLMLQMMVERFGGMVQYLKNCCGASEENIELIQTLLTFTAKDTD
ncbi:tyrosine-protein phosphatase [Aspergillus foveolatus]|uniref:tyrosine-protein phosphatase n=1 Tax=Aspergillus foveolatus TaxID=210207 RepID=UPI003CCD20B0